jgi:hypothetical protein
VNAHVARRRNGLRQQCHGVLSLFRALFVKTPACMLRISPGARLIVERELAGFRWNAWHGFPVS